MENSKKLPHADLAIVEGSKVYDYLLNEDHPHGRSKARFLFSFGWRREDWQVLQFQLREHAYNDMVAPIRQTGFGPRFILEGPLLCPDGRSPTIRTVWQIETGTIAPRLITAYPVE